VCLCALVTSVLLPEHYSDACCVADHYCSWCCQKVHWQIGRQQRAWVARTTASSAQYLRTSIMGLAFHSIMTAIASRLVAFSVSSAQTLMTDRHHWHRGRGAASAS
jgi:hypothetical protein